MNTNWAGHNYTIYISMKTCHPILDVLPRCYGIYSNQNHVETQSAVTLFCRFFGQVEFFIFTPVPNITCNQGAFQANSLTARFSSPNS